MSRDFLADDLAGAARLELVDADGRVVHAFGTDLLSAVQALPAAFACVTPAWRLRVFDHAGRLLADLPARARAAH